MNQLTELAIQLLQTTQALHTVVETGELDSIADLQQQRAVLVAELDAASRHPWPDVVMVESRTFIEQSRALEKGIITLLAEKRDAISHEHNQLQQNQKARKAYDSFS